MIFKDIDGNVVRIPDDKLCGRLPSGNSNAVLWSVGVIENGETVVYEVSRGVFKECMRVLGDETIEVEE